VENHFLEADLWPALQNEQPSAERAQPGRAFDHLVEDLCGSSDSSGTRRIPLKESLRLLRGLLH
jgi:hypothetical protein